MSANKKRNTSTKQKKPKKSNFNIDPIEAFNVFTERDLECLSSGSTTPDISPVRKTICSQQTTDSDDDFYPKSQNVRKIKNKRKANPNNMPKTTPNKISRLPSDDLTLETPKNNSTEKIKSPNSAQQQNQKINVSSVEIVTTALVHNYLEARPSTGKKSVCRNILENENSSKKQVPINCDANAKLGTNKKLKANTRLSKEDNQNKKMKTPKKNSTVKKQRSDSLISKPLPKKSSPSSVQQQNNVSKTSPEPKSHNSQKAGPSTGRKQRSGSPISKPLLEMKINSPKKSSPSLAQQQQNNVSKTSPEPQSRNSQKAGPSTAKKSVCRNIFETENTNNTQILKNYDVNVNICGNNKTLKGKINISNENKLISIDLIDENSSTDTDTVTSSTQATPTKSINNNNISRLKETPTKSPKRVKPKDTKTYKQSSIMNFINNTNNNSETNKTIPNKNKSNNVKNTAVKPNSKYTLESNTRVYENVKNIMDWVLGKENFSTLFTKDETDLLNKFFQLPDTKLTILCLRLFTRQHKWYNLTNLCTELNLKDDSYNYYDVITELNVYVDTDYTDETLDVLLDHLSAGDLRDICCSFKITAPTRKEAMLRKLMDYTNKQCTLTFIKNSDQILRDRIEEKLGICVKLKVEFKRILYMIHLLYSITNSFSTINDIYNVIYKIKSNTVKYPVVQTDSTKIFADRKDFLNYTEATLLRKEYEDQVFKKDIGSQYLLCVEAHKRLLRLFNDSQQVNYDTLKPLFLRRFSASWIYCKVLSSGSLNLGKHYAEEVCQWLRDMLEQETYCLYKRGQWYIQLSLINQSHLKKFVEAADIIIAGINDKDVTEVTKYELSIRGSKITKTKLPQLKYDELQYALLPNLTIPVVRKFEAKAVYRNEQGKKLYFERITEEGKEYRSVEETAINYYKENCNYTYGIHCEGRLLTSLFIIFFWDILYEMNVPNTFITEMQAFPLDLFSTDFYTNRQEQINKRLDDIRNKWNLQELRTFFSSKFNTFNSEINSVIQFDCDVETYGGIIQSIGKVILSAVFERLAKDYRQFHSGLPDLFLWNVTDFKCAFVEVKSENDILSTRQSLWINYLYNVHACVEVCHVQNKGSKKSKKV